MKATCENCDHEWRLRKDPSEYKDGYKCPSCGSTRVDGPEQSQHKPSREIEPAAGTAAGGGRNGEIQPADGVGQMSAVAEEAGRQAIEMRHASAEQKAQMEGQLLSVIGDFIKGAGQKHAEEKLAGIERAKERGGETLSRPDDAVFCPSCDGAMKDLPPEGTEFNCPHCGDLLVS